MDPRPSGSGRRGPLQPSARLQAGWQEPDLRSRSTRLLERGLIRSSRASTQAPRIDSRLGLGPCWRLGPEGSARAARSTATRATLSPDCCLLEVSGSEEGGARHRGPQVLGRGLLSRALGWSLPTRHSSHEGQTRGLSACLEPRAPGHLGKPIYSQMLF